ncbi:MAG TPA: type 4a pilus biogenesis protein PilO, partial [Bacilli bacterium]
LPFKATATDLEKLVRQIPTKDEMARFILSIKELEDLTGVEIQSLSSGEISEDAGASLSDIVEGKATLPPQPANSPTPSPVAPAESFNNAIIQSTLQLEVLGHYSQLIDFIKQIYQMERIVNVTQWSIGIGNPDENNKFMLSTNLIIYKKVQNAAIFKDLPLIPVEEPPLRENPILSDKEFIEQLNKDE